MRLSLILPIYNGCEELKKNFLHIYKYANRLGAVEIIIAEDGSTDCTPKVAKDFTKLKNVRLISKRYRLGKGGAIKSAVAIAKGDTVGYMDIDLAVPLDYIEKAVKEVERGHKIVIGSRYTKQSMAKRSLYRLSESLMYNYMIKFLLGSNVRDHQCGFKFFDSKYLKRIIKSVNDNHWFFDAELLVKAQRRGIKPYEMPIEWHEGKNTKVRTFDTVYFFRSILKLRRELGMKN